MWTTQRIEDCRQGMVVRISRRQEVWEGTVKALLRNPRHVLVVDVPTYYKDGTHRPKWARKSVNFANSRILSIEYDADAWQNYAGSVKQARHAYRAARGLLASLQTLADSHFALLGLNALSSYEEFKATRKTLMRKYHADLVTVRVASLPEADRQPILDEAKRYTDALAFVESYIERRDT